MYVRGNGTGGPWRYVHSILAGINPAEFEVVLFSDLDHYDPQPHVQTVVLPGAAPTSRPEQNSATNAPPPPTRLKVLRKAMPATIKLLAGFYREADRLASVFRAQRLDLLHTNYTGCEESAVAARRAKIPRVVGTFHVDPSYDLARERSGLRHRLIECISNHALDRAIAVSERTKEDWVRRTLLPASRVVTIHNGIDSARFRREIPRSEARRLLGLPLDARILGSVARLDEAKGFTYLLDAVSLLSRAGTDVLLLLAGEGPLKTSLEKKAVQLGIGSRVRFMGFLSDVQPLLDALDVFVLPSLCETLGYAHLEAMATGLPSVGTTVGGVPEVIVPGQTGLLVPPRDPQALASALGMLLGSPEACQRMGAAGRERVMSHFSEREMTRQTIDVYRDLVHATDARSRSTRCARPEQATRLGLITGQAER